MMPQGFVLSSYPETTHFLFPDKSGWAASEHNLGQLNSLLVSA